MTFEFSLDAPRDLAGVVDLRSARYFAQRLSCLASSGAQQARVAMSSSAPESARASSPAIAPTARGASGTTFWPKAFHMVCIASNG